VRVIQLGGISETHSSHRDGSEQNYLMRELESLGLSTIRLNELNDNYELHGLVRRIKDEFLRRYEKTGSQEWFL
jgi:hypothetical protein